MVEWSKDSSPEQLIHRRYNKASAMVDMLKRMIGERELTKKRKERLLSLLSEAEAAKEAARQALEEVGIQYLQCR